MTRGRMTREEAIKYIKSRCIGSTEERDGTQWSEAMWMAIEALADRPTGEWVLDPNGMDWNIPAWRCSECGFVANYIGVEAKGFGNNPMNWAGSKFCPQCGARITGYER